MIAVKKATTRQFAAPQKAIVIDDDDDEIIALDGPSEVPKHNETKKPEVDHLSNTAGSKRSSTTQDTFSHSRHRSSNAASNDHIQPPPGRTSGTKDKQIRIIDDPFLFPDFTPPPVKPLQTPSSSKLSGFVDLTTLSDEGDGSDDDALEYLTPAPTSKQVVEIVHEEVPQILTSNQTHPLPRDVRSTAQTSTMATTSSQLLNHLLTRWLNDRSTTVGVEPDIWARACLRRDRDAANRSLGSKSAHPPSISPPSRRKHKAHNLSERSPTHSRATVFFSAEGWLHEKQASLLLE